MKPTRSYLSPWIWAVYAVLLAISIPWYWPQEVGTIVLGMPLWAAVTVTVINSFFVQAGCGAVYGIIPLIKRRLTGQIAGMSGAYGNVGSVVFLTVLSFVTPSTFWTASPIFARIWTVGTVPSSVTTPLAAVTVQQAGPPSDGLLRDWPRIDLGVDKHYGYAVQWFALAGLIALLYGWFQIVKRFFLAR